MAALAFLQNLFGAQKKIARKTIAQYKQDILVNAGREQFKYLLKKNIRIPIVLL